VPPRTYKNVNIKIVIKGMLKMTFLWKAPQAKKFAEIFCEAFLMKTNNLLSHLELISVFKKRIFRENFRFPKSFLSKSYF
jgi:hypothetical protein